MSDQKPQFDPTKPFEAVSDKPPFDPTKPFEPVDAGIHMRPGLADLVQGLQKVNETIDPYTGAPIRAALGEIKKNPTSLMSIPNAAVAYIDQFGKPGSQAPTGKQLAPDFIPDKPMSEIAPWAYTEKPGATLQLKKNGLLDVNPKNVAGFGIDVAADPLVLSGLAGKTLSFGGRVGLLAASPSELAKELRAGAEFATKSHLRPTPAFAEKLGPEGLQRALGQTLDSGAMRPFSKVAATAENLRTAKANTGIELGNLVKNSKATIDPAEIASRLRTEVLEPLKTNEATATEAARVEKLINQFESRHLPGSNVSTEIKGAADATETAPMTLAQTELRKKAWQKKARYDVSKPGSDMNSALKGVANVFKSVGETAELNPKFTELKDAFGATADASKMADRTSKLSHGGLLSHITDTGIGVTAGALMHNPIVAASLIGGRFLVKGKTASTVGVGLNEMSKLISLAPDIAKEIGVPVAEVNTFLKSNEAKRAFNMLYGAGTKGADSLSGLKKVADSEEPPDIAAIKRRQKRGNK